MAGVKPQRKIVEDDNASHAGSHNSISSSVHMANLIAKRTAAQTEAALFVVKAAEAANKAKLAALEAEIAQAALDSTAKSRKAESMCSNIDFQPDAPFDLSGVLDKIIDDGLEEIASEMNLHGNQQRSPLSEQALVKHNLEGADDLSTTQASTTHVKPTPFIPTLPTPETEFQSVSGTPNTSEKPVGEPAVFVKEVPPSYGPVKGTARDRSPFQRGRSPAPKERVKIPRVPSSPSQPRFSLEEVSKIKEDAEKAVTDEAVRYLSDIQERITIDHREKLQQFELAESAIETTIAGKHSELFMAERARLESIADAAFRKARSDIELSAKLKMAEFEQQMMHQQQDVERVKLETAAAYREQQQEALRANLRAKEAEDKVIQMQERIRASEVEREKVQREANAKIDLQRREFAVALERIDRHKQQRKDTPDSHYIGDHTPEPKPRRQAVSSGSRDPPKPPRPSAGLISLPSKSERGRSRTSKPTVTMLPGAAFTGSKTVTITYAKRPPDDGGDDGDDGDSPDKQRKDKKEKKDKGDEDRRDKGRKKRPSDDDPSDDPGDDDNDDDGRYSDDDDDDDSQDDDDRTADERKAEKIMRRAIESSKARSGKEADKITLPAISNAAAFRNWRVHMRSCVVAASGKGEKAFRWIQEVESTKITLDKLKHTGHNFQSLDAKLLSAITDKCHGELGRVITQKIEEAAAEGKMLRGRQALFIIYEYMRVSELAGALYDLSDLMAVRLNQDKLESFLNTWESTLTGMKQLPDPNTKEVLFLKQLRRSDSMKVEIAHYDRADVGTPDHSYEFLMNSVKKLIQRRRQEHNRKEIELYLGGGKAPALAAEGKGGKGKGKGKGTKPCFALRLWRVHCLRLPL